MTKAQNAKLLAKAVDGTPMPQAPDVEKLSAEQQAELRDLVYNAVNAGRGVWQSYTLACYEQNRDRDAASEHAGHYAAWQQNYHELYARLRKLVYEELAPIDVDQTCEDMMRQVYDAQVAEEEAANEERPSVVSRALSLLRGKRPS